MATSRSFTDKLGVKQQQSEFHNIVAWGRQAEIINQFCKKGSLLLVEGRLQTRSWDDDKGQKHYKTEIVAEQIQLGPRPTGQPKDEENPVIDLAEDDEIDVSKLVDYHSDFDAIALLVYSAAKTGGSHGQKVYRYPDGR